VSPRASKIDVPEPPPPAAQVSLAATTGV